MYKNISIKEQILHEEEINFFFIKIIIYNTCKYNVVF